MSINRQRAVAGDEVTFIFHAVDSSNDPVTGGSNFDIAIYRTSDDTWLDWSDDTFGGTITTRWQSLSQIDATNMPGVYTFEYTLADVTNHATTMDTWIIVTREETTTTAGFLPVGELVLNPPDLIAALYQGQIYIDANNGTAGSVLGLHGTPGKPTTTAALADTLSSSTGFKTWNIAGNISLNAAEYYNYRFNGIGGALFSQITLNSKIVRGCHFEGLIVTGAMGASANAAFSAHRCYLTALTNIRAFDATECKVDGAWSFAAATIGLANMHRCVDGASGAGSLSIALTGADTVFLRLADYTGAITITGCDDAGNDIDIYGSGSAVTLDSSCTAGSILVSGLVAVTDNSAGSTVTKKQAVDPQLLNIAAGVLFGNSIRDNVSDNIDGNGFVTSQRIRVFDSSGNVPSSGGGSETTGLLGTLTGTATADTVYPLEPALLRWLLTKA
jgi:hypothetical protein